MEVEPRPINGNVHGRQETSWPESIRRGIWQDRGHNEIHSHADAQSSCAEIEWRSIYDCDKLLRGTNMIRHRLVNA